MLKKSLEKAFPFRENYISICYVNLSLKRRQYFWWAVNVLKNSPEFCLSLGETFLNLTAFTVINKYRKSGVIQISALFDPIYYVACRRVLWNATF